MGKLRIAEPGCHMRTCSVRGRGHALHGGYTAVRGEPTRSACEPDPDEGHTGAD